MYSGFGNLDTNNRTFKIELGAFGFSLNEANCTLSNCVLKLPTESDSLTESKKNYHTQLRNFIAQDFTNADCLVVGVNSDVFLNNFEQAILLLKILGEHSFKHIHIQTRSPLILLATPLLKALKKRVSVCIALESASDSLAKELTPTLPRPSERIIALKTLSTLGITTYCQISPLIGSNATRQEINLLVSAATSAYFAKVVKVSDIVTSISSARLLYLANDEICRITAKRLNKLMPNRVFWKKDLLTTTNKAAA